MGFLAREKGEIINIGLQASHHGIANAYVKNNSKDGSSFKELTIELF